MSHASSRRIPDGNVLLTGATDGIGLALARRWRSEGARPFLHGRRSAEEVAANLNLEAERYIQADLASPDATDGIEAALDGAGVEELDLLVLNAGAGWYGDLAEQEPARIRELCRINLWSAMELSHRLLPRLRRARGRIAFVSSVVSALPLPQYAVYTATKAAIEGFARSLRIEEAPETEGAEGVEVQVLRPGATRTGMHEKSGVPQADVDWERFPRAEDVAEKMDAALRVPAHWVTIGATNRVARFAGRNLPALVDHMQKARSSS